jgi:hypothetical protein
MSRTASPWGRPLAKTWKTENSEINKVSECRVSKLLSPTVAGHPPHSETYETKPFSESSVLGPIHVLCRVCSRKAAKRLAGRFPGQYHSNRHPDTKSALQLGPCVRKPGNVNVRPLRP